MNWMIQNHWPASVASSPQLHVTYMLCSLESMSWTLCVLSKFEENHSKLWPLGNVQGYSLVFVTSTSSAISMSKNSRWPICRSELFDTSFPWLHYLTICCSLYKFRKCFITVRNTSIYSTHWWCRLPNSFYFYWTQQPTLVLSFGKPMCTEAYNYVTGSSKVIGHWQPIFLCTTLVFPVVLFNGSKPWDPLYTGTAHHPCFIPISPPAFSYQIHFISNPAGVHTVISRKFLIKYYEYSFEYLTIIMDQLWLTLLLSIQYGLFLLDTDLRNLLSS